MFGNRKGKLQEDEESLVPHGLIWHATVEPTPEEVAKNEEALGYTVNYAQEIERARREQSVQPSEQPPEASQASPIRPAVIPWWRVEQPEAPIVRPVSKLTPMPLSAYVPTPIEPAIEPSRPSRIEAMQSRPTSIRPVDVQRVAGPSVVVQPIQAISASAPVEPPAQILQTSTPQVQGSMAMSAQVDLPATSEPPVFKSPASKPQVEERLVPMSSEITEALALAFSRLRSASKTAWLSLGWVSGKAIERGRQTVRSLELGDGLARVGEHGQNLIRRGMAKTGYYARTTGSAFAALSRAGASRIQQVSARVRTASRPAHEDVVRPANTRLPAPSRVRVLLAASALQARIITAQRLSAWRLRRERMAVDSRFWASMTMSAIAAIIALVIVSVVPHYAARSLPSRLLNTNPSVDANVAAPVATAAPVRKADTPSRKTTTATGAQTAPPKANSAKTDSSKAATNPKPKHVVYDDYVAPNTYKYYGTGSKASR
jgi:hypothetical protein